MHLHMKTVIQIIGNNDIQPANKFNRIIPSANEHKQEKGRLREMMAVIQPQKDSPANSITSMIQGILSMRTMT